MDTPTRTTNLPAVSAIDEIVGNVTEDGVQRTRRISVENVARQLAGTAPLRYLSGVAPIFETAAELLAASITDKVAAWVINDPDVSKVGIWGWNGSAWVWALPLPYEIVPGVDAGAGTANAIQITTRVPVTDGMMVVFPLFRDTTGAPVAVSINGGPALTLVTNRGNAASSLTAEMEIFGRYRSSDSTLRMQNDQDVSALVAQAEAARDAAVAAAASVARYATRAAASAFDLSGVGYVSIDRWDISSDHSPTIYEKATSEPAHAAKFQSLDGSWWQIYPRQNLHVESFGAVSKARVELEAMAGVGASAWANATTDAMQSAVDFVHAMGGGDILAAGQFYALSGNGVEIKDGVHIHCACHDEWEPVYNNAKDWQGTTWLLYGTGTKHLQFPGITSGEHGGGWREDPDAPGTYYKMFTAYNSDASGTTPATLKSFSAGFWSNEACNNGLYRCRVANWCGTNGIEGYDDPAGGLGADWDFFVVGVNGDGLRRKEIQAVGYAREMAFLACTTTSINSRMEKCRFEDITAQGRGGIGIRGPDRWAVYNTTANSFEIEWSNQHYFDPNGGTAFRLSDNVNRTYTNTVMVGSNRLKFEGVSPSPAGMFHLRHAGRGWAGTIIRNTHTYSLYHHSGDDVVTLGLEKMAAVQISGFPIRGLLFDGKTKAHCSNRARERALVQIWDAQDCYFNGTMQVEGGRWMFATDISSAVSYCAAPVGEVRNIRFEFSEGMDDLFTAGYLEQTWFPRNAFDPSRQLGGRQYLDGHNHILPYRAGKRNILHDDQLAEFFDCREITTTSVGFSFVTVTSQTCTWRYVKIGKIVFFKMVAVWSGLDTADDSAISIRLPVNAASTAPFNATVNDRRSTGINLAGVDNPYVDLATDNYLGISRSDTTRLLYNGGQIAASGELHIAGSYWVD